MAAEENFALDFVTDEVIGDEEEESKPRDIVCLFSKHVQFQI